MRPNQRDVVWKGSWGFQAPRFVRLDDVIYAFATFVVDTKKRELKSSGQPVRVEPKAFDILVHLLDHRERAVPKDELILEVWGGRFLSDAAISSGISTARKALGDSGEHQEFIRTIHGHGFRFIYPDVVTTDDEDAAKPERVEALTSQEIRFCQSADGTRIAYATAGLGPPLVKAANWLSHLEYDWESPVWRHFFRTLVQDQCLVRYDARGNGLSDWDASDHTSERQLEDLEAVIETVKLDRFSMIGISQGCMRAVTYAAKYPERVEKLILIGGYTRGWQLRQEDQEGYAFRQSAFDMIGHWWGKDNPAVRQLFTSMYMPDSPPEGQNWFTELQRKTASSESAAKMLVSGSHDDIRPILEKVKAPTLVIHAIGDVAAPYSQGRELAAGIKGARFSSLDTANHLMPETDPAWAKCAKLISEFLAE